MAYQSWSVVFGEQPSASKWNILGTNDSSFNDGTGIAADAIHPNHLTAGLSPTTWAWQTWTPTFTNLTVGNGTLTSRYGQTGKTVFARISLVFGSTSAVSGDTTFTLPVTAATHAGSANTIPIGQAGLFDVSVGRNYIGHIAYSSTTTGKIVANAADISFLYGFVLSSTAPFTWASGDQILLALNYEAA